MMLHTAELVSILSLMLLKLSASLEEDYMNIEIINIRIEPLY